jgi:hypothetical protein
MCVVRGSRSRDVYETIYLKKLFSFLRRTLTVLLFLLFDLFLTVRLEVMMSGSFLSYIHQLTRVFVEKHFFVPL